MKRSATDAEPPLGVPIEKGTDESAALPSALAANTTRRIAEKSAPLKKAMMIASVEQVEFGQHHRVVNNGSCASMGKKIEPLSLGEDMDGAFRSTVT